MAALFQRERYNAVLPKETEKLKEEAIRWADELVTRHREFWQLKVKKQKGVTKRPASAPEGEPPGSQG